MVVKDIISYIQKNEGEVKKYGDGYSIQVYRGEPLQAQIEYNGVSILKIEMNTDVVNFYLSKEDDPAAIEYAKKCALRENDDIINIKETFKGHKDIEKVFMALLQLQEKEN